MDYRKPRNNKFLSQKNSHTCCSPDVQFLFAWQYDKHLLGGSFAILPHSLPVLMCRYLNKRGSSFLYRSYLFFLMRFEHNSFVVMKQQLQRSLNIARSCYVVSLTNLRSL